MNIYESRTCRVALNRLKSNTVVHSRKKIAQAWLYFIPCSICCIILDLWFSRNFPCLQWPFNVTLAGSRHASMFPRFSNMKYWWKIMNFSSIPISTLLIQRYLNIGDTFLLFCWKFRHFDSKRNWLLKISIWTAKFCVHFGDVVRRINYIGCTFELFEWNA